MRLIAWLDRHESRRMLSESWFWKRFHANHDSLHLRAAIVNVQKSRYLNTALTWPTDTGRAPSAESQIVILSVAWLRGEIGIPGLGQVDARWSWQDVADLAAELRGSNSLPWYAIDDRKKVMTVVGRARNSVYGGCFEVVKEPVGLTESLENLFALAV
jgi:hypothetical protein